MLPALAVVLATSRIAVVSVGGDPATTGQLQRGVETRLVALPSVELMDAGAIAAQIGVKPAEPISAGMDAEARKKVDDLLETARQDSRNGEYEEALGRLHAAEALLDEAATEDRVRLFLQKSAVLLKMDDHDKAASAARSALELQPDLVVDLGVFPPSVNSLVGEVRATVPLRYTIELENVPALARVVVDGRKVGRRFAATPGRHKLSVASPGFRTLDTVLDVSRNATIDASLAIALPGPQETALFEQVWAADAGTKSRPAARDLAATLAVDGIVLVGSRTAPSSDARALVVWRSGERAPELSPAKPSVAAGRTALIEWIAQRVEAGGPRPGPVVEVPRRPRTPAVIDVRGGLAIVSRHREVSGTGGAGFETRFTGAGPRVTAEARKRRWTARLEVATIQFGSTRVNRPEGGNATIDGGLGTNVQLGFGYTFGSDTLRVTPTVGPYFDRIEGKDAQSSSGKALHLHPGQIWFDASGRLEIASTFLERWRVIAAGTYHPGGGTVFESPQNTTGDFEIPRAGVNGNGWIAELGVAWKPIERLWMGLDLAHTQRSVRFRGTADAPFTPPIVDATDEQTIDLLQVSARYRF